MKDMEAYEAIERYRRLRAALLDAELEERLMRPCSPEQSFVNLCFMRGLRRRRTISEKEPSIV